MEALTAAEGSDNDGTKRAGGGTHTGDNAAKRARRSGSEATAGATAEGATRKGGLCPHQRQRSRCKECGGAGICQHQRQRSRCKEGGGASLCQHQRERSKCKECGGASETTCRMASVGGADRPAGHCATGAGCALSRCRLPRLLRPMCPQEWTWHLAPQRRHLQQHGSSLPSTHLQWRPYLESRRKTLHHPSACVQRDGSTPEIARPEQHRPTITSRRSSGHPGRTG